LSILDGGIKFDFFKTDPQSLTDIYPQSLRADPTRFVTINFDRTLLSLHSYIGSYDWIKFLDNTSIADGYADISIGELESLVYGNASGRRLNLSSECTTNKLIKGNTYVINSLGTATLAQWLDVGADVIQDGLDILWSDSSSPYDHQFVASWEGAEEFKLVNDPGDGNVILIS